METRKQIVIVMNLLALLAGANLQVAGSPIGTAFTYHGRLTDGGAPATGAYDFYCLVYDAETGGSPVGDSVRRDAVVVSEGMFLLELDFGPDAFAGEARWLEIQVRPSGPDPYTTLSPRQRISPTPYALYASNAGLAAQATTALGVADHSVTGAGIADGTITRADLGRNTVWMAGGNAGTEPGTHFLGTVDAQPLSLRVNDAEAARFATDGNLGLGTATPTQKLDVAGSIAYSGQLTKLDVAENQAATVRAANFEFGHSTRRGGPGLALVDWGPALQVNYDGWSSTWLGGTTVVDPEDANDGMLMPGLAFGQNSGEGIASRRAEGENRWGLDFYTDGASRLSVANNGNVGIGTRSPQAKLDVAAGDALVRGPDFGAPGDSAHLYLGDESHYIRSVWGSGLRLGTYQAPDAFVLQETSGNVGIGTSEPQAKLGVNGLVRAQAFGSMSGQPTLEFVTDDISALRLERTGDSLLDLDELSDGAPNVIGGSPNNWVAASVVGATIGGGGASNLDGGPMALNSVAGNFTTIGGGGQNLIDTEADFATIGGGWQNSIFTDAASATISGGYGNSINVGSGDAVIGGGHGNWISSNAGVSTISGGGQSLIGEAGNATIGGGRLNYVESGAHYATIPGGTFACARCYGQQAYASGNFAKWTPGDAQTSLYVLRNATTGTAQGELFLDGSGERMTIPPHSTWAFEALVVARTPDIGEEFPTAQSAGYRIRGVIQNAGGTVSMPGATGDVLYESDASWNAVAQADQTHGALVIKVSGSTGTTVRWVASVRTSEVMFP